MQFACQRVAHCMECPIPVESTQTLDEAAPQHAPQDLDDARTRQEIADRQNGEFTTTSF